MYDYFKSVLKVTKEEYIKALNGKSGKKVKLQDELLEVTYNLQKSFRDGDLTEKQYKELSREFGKISFLDLANRRNGKYAL